MLGIGPAISPAYSTSGDTFDKKSSSGPQKFFGFENLSVLDRASILDNIKKDSMQIIQEKWIL